MDLRDQLDQIAGPAPAVSAAQADADVARGRSALRRRRTGRTAAGSVFGVAALVAAFSLAAGGTGPHGPASGGGRPVVAGARLVAYQGAQPKGFTIDKVPAGYVVQSDDDSTLLLAPVGAKDTDPDSFVGKITIMLESKDQHGPSQGGTPVTVAGRPGVLVRSLNDRAPARGDTGWTLWVEQPTGIHLLVQFWAGLGLSQDQMVELGAGVHVHADAQQGVG